MLSLFKIILNNICVYNNSVYICRIKMAEMNLYQTSFSLNAGFFMAPVHFISPEVSMAMR
jgi:hypothetical protein